MKNALEKNKEYSNQYIQRIEKIEIPGLIKEIIKKTDKIVDLGCGDGGLIIALKKEFPDKEIIGVDISPRRINTLKNKYPKDKFLCEDVCNTKLKENSFNLVISTQVIEHVEDDKKLVNEMLRLCKKNGYIYVTSVIKKPWAIYKYRNKGKFVLDPTHEKEYKNAKEFLDLFRGYFKLIKYKVYSVRRKFLFFEIKIPGYYIIEGLWQKK